MKSNDKKSKKKRQDEESKAAAQAKADLAEDKKRKRLLHGVKALFASDSPAQEVTTLKRCVYTAAIDWMTKTVGDWAQAKKWWVVPSAKRAQVLETRLNSFLNGLPANPDDLDEDSTKLLHEIHDYLTEKGLEKRNKSELIALMHTELSEATEGLRHGDPADDKVPTYPTSWVEMADVVIRIHDYCAAEGIPLGDIILAKTDFNWTRPDRHGKKF